LKQTRNLTHSFARCETRVRTGTDVISWTKITLRWDETSRTRRTTGTSLELVTFSVGSAETFVNTCHLQPIELWFLLYYTFSNVAQHRRTDWRLGNECAVEITRWRMSLWVKMHAATVCKLKRWNVLSSCRAAGVVFVRALWTASIYLRQYFFFGGDKPDYRTNSHSLWVERPAARFTDTAAAASPVVCVITSSHLRHYRALADDVSTFITSASLVELMTRYEQ